MVASPVTRIENKSSSTPSTTYRIPLHSTPFPSRYPPHRRPITPCPPTNKSKPPVKTEPNPKAQRPPRANSVLPKTPSNTACSPKPSSSKPKTKPNSSPSSTPTRTNTNPSDQPKLTLSSKSSPASGASTAPVPWRPSSSTTNSPASANSPG